MLPSQTRYRVEFGSAIQHSRHRYVDGILANLYALASEARIVPTDRLSKMDEPPSWSEESAELSREHTKPAFQGILI